MGKIKDLPSFSRPREKLFEKGADALRDHELVAILLRTGYQGKSALDVAKRIIKQTSLARLSNLSLPELAKIKGVGRSRAASIAAAFALGQRVSGFDHKIKINKPEDVLKVTSFLLSKKREYLVVLCLNARHQLIDKKIVSVGTLTANLVHPREVFHPVIKNHAAQIILVHNHPSGDPTPSKEDLELTSRINQAGRILGIELIDHVVIARDGYQSIEF